jgi:hypothetical protein
MKLTQDHVHRFVDEIHVVLLETVREAARRAVTADVAGGGAVAQGLDFLRLKGFENAVVVAAQQALEEWRGEAHRVAEMMVQMECDYVTPSFFRDLERRHQEEAAGGGGGGGADGPSDRLDRLAAGEVSVGDDADGYDSDAESGAEVGSPQGSRASPPPAGGPGLGPALAAPQRDDLKQGWLEKRAGDTSNLASLPVDSWRWQRRWCVLALDAGVFYYFRAPEQVTAGPSAARATIPLRDCLVEDFHPESAGMPASRRSTQRDGGGGGAVSMLIRISHRNPNMPVAKDHHQCILRAPTAEVKYEWLRALRAATEPAPPRAGGGGAANGARAPAGAAPAPYSGATGERGLFGRTVTKVTGQFQRLAGGLGGSKLGDVMAVGGIEDLDEYYERLGLFCGLYARSVYDRLAKTVPKAIILCQVIRSRDRLLDQLFNYISSLSPKEIEFMLAEDPVAARRRTAAAQASKDLAEAGDEVRRAQEERAAAGPAERRADGEAVSVRTLLLAGAFPLVPRDRVPAGVNPALLYGEHTPLTLSPAAGEGPPQLGQPVGPRPAAAGAAEAAPAAAAENGAAAAAGAAASSGGAAGKPRRQPPPPPPK